MRAFKQRPAGHDYHWRLTLLRKGPDSREGRTGRRDAVPRLLVVGSAPHANSSLPWQQQVVLEERGSWFAPRAALVTPRMPVAVADPPPNARCPALESQLHAHPAPRPPPPTSAPQCRCLSSPLTPGPQVFTRNPLLMERVGADCCLDPARV